MSAILAGRYFTIGRALGRSGIALRRIWLVFILATLLIGLPELYFYQLVDDRFERESLASLLLGSFGFALFDGVGIGWLTAAVLAADAGQKPSPASSLRRALPAWPALVPVLGVNYFSWSLLFIETNHWRGAVCLVAAIVIAVAFWVYGPAVVAERLGLLAGWRRGLALISGNGWRVVVLVVLTLVVNFVLVGIAWSVLPYGLDAEFSLAYGASLSLAGVLNSLISNALAVLAAVSYVLLRNDKDGVPVEEVAPVFD